MLARSRTLGSADRAIAVKLGERAGDGFRERERGEVVCLRGPRLSAPGHSLTVFQNFKPVSSHLSNRRRVFQKSEWRIARNPAS